jgi:hypothetical protein
VTPGFNATGSLRIGFETSAPNPGCIDEVEKFSGIPSEKARAARLADLDFPKSGPQKTQFTQVRKKLFFNG